MPKREAALKSLLAGDFFEAHFTEWPAGGRGPGLICLVTAVTEEHILARTVTTQVHFTFDRITGRSESYDPDTYPLKHGNQLVAVINSIAPLPVDMHNVLLGLDRKHRLDQYSENPERQKLTSEEKRALLFLDRHYPENPM